jgi:biotin carboxylase
MGPHVLVIGDLRPAHRKLVALGARLTLMIPANRVQTKDMAFYERQLILPPNADEAEWIALATALHHIDPIAAIGGFQELLQDKAALIAAALGLPFHALEVIQATRQKDMMRRMLQAAGVDRTANRRVSSAAQIAGFAADYGYPLILKPVDGQASRSVSLLRSAADADAALSWSQGDSQPMQMLVEPFLEGDEFSVEALSEGGAHYMICITRKYKESEHFIELGHCLPAALAPETAARIYRTVSDALTALGLLSGPSHTEVIVCGEQVHIVETHARPAGDHIFELIEAVSGIDLIELWVRQALGESVVDRLPTLPLPLDSCAAIWYAPPVSDGIVANIQGEDVARALPGVLKVKAIAAPGARMSGLHGSSSRPAYAIATAAAPDQALARAQAAIRQLTIELIEEQAAHASTV